MNTNTVITHQWQRDLFMCPSQIYYYFKDPKTNKRYCIYLRWRWDDPWTAELVEQSAQWDFTDKLSGWERLTVNYYTHDDYPKLEVEVLDIIAKRFPHIKFKKED